MNNLSSYCGLVDAKIRASDKDLPVRVANPFVNLNYNLENLQKSKQKISRLVFSSQILQNFEMKIVVH